MKRKRLAQKSEAGKEVTGAAAPGFVLSLSDACGSAQWIKLHENVKAVKAPHFVQDQSKLFDRAESNVSHTAQ